MNPNLCHEMIDNTASYYETLIRKFIEHVARETPNGSNLVPPLALDNPTFTFEELETLHRLACEPD